MPAWLLSSLLSCLHSSKRGSLRLAGLVGMMCLSAATHAQTTYTVTTLSDNAATPPSGSLRQAIVNANSAGGANTIHFSAGLSGAITLVGDLPAIADNGLTIDGTGASISIGGNNTYRCFFVGAWAPGTSTQIAVNVTIANITFSGCKAQGGAGGAGGSVGSPSESGFASGGGGAGLGGAVFVANLGSLTLSNVNFAANSAQGGYGGAATSTTYSASEATGGGGMGGNGGAADPSAPNAGGTGGGGLGVGADGGTGQNAGSTGIATGAASGGSSYFDCNSPGTTPGGSSGGGGGGGIAGAEAQCVLGGGGGGGVGGATASYTRGGVAGAAGGFGGGSGGGTGEAGGTAAGGFGGGGGGYFAAVNLTSGSGGTGGAGGFGGGGGGGGYGYIGEGTGTAAGAGGFGGGDGTAAALGLGGGGLGAGGAVFVQQGGTITFSGTLAESGDTVTAGAAYAGGNNGSAFGSAIFLQGNDAISFSPGSGITQTISGVIADQTGSGGTGTNAGGGSVTVNGAGTLVLSGANTYTAPTFLLNGTLEVNGSTGASTIIVGNGTLTGSGTINGQVVRLTSGSGRINFSNGLQLKQGITLESSLEFTATAGTPQTGEISGPFATPLTVAFTTGSGAGLAGAVVNFSVPASGASATLSAVSCLTDSTGSCSVIATANSTFGSYDVTASVAGLTVSFALSNQLSIYIVNSTSDSITGACTVFPSTVTSNHTDSNCTLRAAMAGAGTLGAADIYFDPTVFASAQTITLTGANGPLMLAPIGGIGSPVPMTVHGPGAKLLTISGGNQTNVFNFTGATISNGTFTVGTNTVKVSGLTIANGKNTDGSGAGGMTFGPGATYVDSCVFTGNTAGGGGAIVTLGSLTLTNSTFTNNEANGAESNGGNDYGGGAILIDESTSDSFTVNINHNTFSQNISGTYGGAIAAWGVLTQLSDNTFSGNLSGDFGGAIYMNTGPSAITNNTFALNSSSSFGGAILVAGYTTATVSNNIFAGNTAQDNGSGMLYIPPINFYNDITGWLNASYNVYYLNEYNNSESDCVQCASNTNAVSASISPIGLPLFDFNNAPTSTYLPQPGSPAICNGSASAAASAGVTSDQRGVALNLTGSNASTYTGAGGYCPAGSMDAGSVQTSYAISFTTQPKPISPATAFYINTPFQVAVALDESGALLDVSGVTIPLSLTTNGSQSAALANTTNGVATYSGAEVFTTGTTTATASLPLAILPSVTLSINSNSFNVLASSSPTITSANNVGFALNQSNTFTVTTTGAPAPAITASCSGNSFSTYGLSFTDNGNGTATISGTPNSHASTGTTFTCTLTASNGTSPNATQSFTVTFGNAMAVANVTSTEIAYGTADVSLRAFVNYASGHIPSGAFTFQIGSGSAVTASCAQLTSTENICAAAPPTSTILPGTYTITATQAGDSYYVSASGTGTLTISAPPVISNVSGPEIAYGTANVALRAFVTYTSGHIPSGAVTFQVGSGSAVAGSCAQLTSTENICAGGYPTSSLLPGTYAITVTEAADSYYGSSSGTGSLTVDGITPTISFSIPEKHAVDAAFTVAASSNSAGAITYSLVSGAAAGPATVSSAGLVTLSGTAGTVQILASQAANGTYASTTATASFLVAAGSVWAVNGAGGIGMLDLAGNAFSSTAYTGASLSTVTTADTIAFDAGGNAWIASAGGVSEFNLDGAPVSSTAYTGGGIASPVALAVDGAGMIWIANANSTISVLKNSGTAVSPAGGYPATSTGTPGGLTIDLSGNVWVANQTTGTVAEMIGAATPVAPVSSALQNGTVGAKP